MPDVENILKLPVHRLDGALTGEEVSLDPRLFSVARNEHVVYLAVKAEMTNRRQGTRAVKSRSYVRGGGRKPWRQKGRGNARAGSTRSPIWKGGGTMFGPQPTEFEMKLPRKVKRLARRIAFSVKAADRALVILEDFDFEQPKTKRIADSLAHFNAAWQSCLFLIDGNKPNIVKSCRNIPRVSATDSLNASITDILRARRLFISRSALRSLEGGLIDE